MTSTGKKQRTAAITIFESWLSVPNQLFVIGAKAMIGIAFAAIANGISAVASSRQRARTSATTIPAEHPITQPPNASWNVNHACAPERVALGPRGSRDVGGRRQQEVLDVEAADEPLPERDAGDEDDDGGEPVPEAAARRARRGVPRGIGSTTVELTSPPPPR